MHGRAFATFSLATLVAVLAGCGSQVGPSSSASSPTAAASEATTPRPASPSPAPSAAAAVPRCADAPMPAWAATLAEDQDGVDPAGRIVFGSITREDVVGQVLGSLYAIDPDGSDLVRLLTCEVERPRISPDGRQVALSIVMSDGTWQIATIDIDGGNLRVLTTTHGYAQWPSWMPDGQSIVYGQAPELCDMAVECANVQHTVWQMDADGSNQRQIGNPSMFDTEVRLSRDGSEIVFDRYDPATDQRGFTIRVLATGEERRVTTTNTTDITHPDWTPDGRSIIYNTNGDGTNGIGQQIETVPADDPTAKPTHLYGDLQHDAFKPAFSPDGSRIAFGCGPRICLMDADGSNVVVLVEAPDTQLNQPAWG